MSHGQSPLNACVSTLIEASQKCGRLRSKHQPELTAVRELAETLVCRCKELRKQKDCCDNHVRGYADELLPIARNLLTVAQYLADGRYVTHHSDEYRTPDVALHNAARAGILAEFGAPCDGQFADVLDDLAFGVATQEDYLGVLMDPSFWLPKLRSAVATDVPGFRFGMFDLAAFSPHANALRKAGITTFGKFQDRITATTPADLATALSTNTLVVANLIDLTELATSRPELTNADVLAVFIEAGITSIAELDSRILAGRAGLVTELRTAARRQGRATLQPIEDLESWLPLEPATDQAKTASRRYRCTGASALVWKAGHPRRA